MDVEHISQSSHWIGTRGYGIRHHLEDAPFSLWDHAQGSFHLPSVSELRWIMHRYNASGVSFEASLIVIQTPNPPNPPPLTIGAEPTRFVLPPSLLASDSPIDKRLRPMLDTRPIRFTTGYEGRREPKDPLPFKFRKWHQPTDEQLESLCNAVSQYCSPRLIHILCPFIVVELRCDEQRTYGKGSMPRSLGGFCAIYYRGEDSAFRALSGHGEMTSSAPKGLQKLMEGYSHEDEIERRMLRSQEIPDGSWFRVHGTPGVFLVAAGLTLVIPPPAPAHQNEGAVTKIIIYRICGTMDLGSREGLCGAAIITDDNTGEEGLAGFFQEGNDQYAFSPCLDDLIRGDWIIV